MTINVDGKTVLTAEAGFAAMFEFLKSYWSEFNGTANLADVLSDMQPADRGRSSDPAAWAQWLRSVEKVLV